MLAQKYNSAIDMWSFGCICAELFLGIPLFPGNSEWDQLAKIFLVCGMPDQSLLDKSKYFKRNEETGMFEFKTLDEYR